MAKPEWGTKRVCQACGTKFYDFNRNPINCPKCGAEFDPEALLRSRRTRPPAPAKPSKPVKEATVPADEAAEEDVGEELDLEEVDEDLGELPDDEEEDEAVIEDTSDLEDEDVTKVVGPGGETEE